MGEGLSDAGKKTADEIKKPRTLGIALFIAALCGIVFWPLAPATFILSIFMLREEKSNPGKYGDSLKLIKTVWGLSVLKIAVDAPLRRVLHCMAGIEFTRLRAASTKPGQPVSIFILSG